MIFSLQRIGRLIASLILILFASTLAIAGDSLFQYSTIDALLAGVYDGAMTMQELKSHGNFGLGTLNGINGELVVLDGNAYHVSAGGKTDIPADSAKVPFATVSFFAEDITLKLQQTLSLEELNNAVTAGLPTKNAFYAIRIDTRFNEVKARAIPKQHPPYLPLAQVVKDQVVVQFTGEGTLVGYYSPPFVKGVNVPGFHWHFLTKDRTCGGHVLDCSFGPTTARIDGLRSFTVELPDSEAFNSVDLSGDKGKELNAVEKGSAKKE